MTSKNLIKNPSTARAGSTRAASSRGIRFLVGSGVYSAAVEFLRDVAAQRDEILSQCEPQKIVQRRASEVLLRSISSFHGDPRYASDLHRADMAGALLPLVVFGFSVVLALTKSAGRPR
jgi:hypothetical protein